MFHTRGGVNWLKSVLRTGWPSENPHALKHDAALADDPTRRRRRMLLSDNMRYAGSS